MPKHFLMILLQCTTEAAAEREHHLMNNSKSGRQDIYSSVASERRDKKIQNAKPQKKLRKRERGLKVGNHYNVNSQCLQLSGILPVEGDGSFALMINLSGEISWHTCHTRFRFYF